ncbi:MAG: MFS transporter [Armatimonadota bacterium]|nr:MFS transporter [Armatimonadota bacterium]
MIGAQAIPPVLRRQIWMLFATIFLAMIGMGIIMPILPFFAREFGASPVQMGLLITGWSLAQFLAAPFWGLLVDRLGRKPVLLTGLCGFGLTFVGMALAQSYAILLAARIAGGLLSSAVLPSAQAIAADLTPPEERGAVMGMMGAGFGLGFLVGPALGGALALLGPRMPFYAAAVSAGLALPTVFRSVHEPAMDARRAATAHLGAAALVRALQSPERPLYLMAFATTFGGSSLFSMLGYYAMDRVSASPSSVGIMFTALGLGSVVTQGFLVGPITRRWGEVPGIRLGFLGGTLGFIALSWAASVFLITVAVLVTSTAMALLRPALAALNSRRTTLGYGTSLGMQTAFDSLGRTLGPLWAGSVYDVARAGPFLAAAGVYLVAGLATLRLTDDAAARGAPPPLAEPMEPPAS